MGRVTVLNLSDKVIRRLRNKHSLLFRKIYLFEERDKKAAFEIFRTFLMFTLTKKGKEEVELVRKMFPNHMGRFRSQHRIPTEQETPVLYDLLDTISKKKLIAVIPIQMFTKNFLYWRTQLYGVKKELEVVSRKKNVVIPAYLHSTYSWESKALDRIWNKGSFVHEGKEYSPVCNACIFQTEKVLADSNCEPGSNKCYVGLVQKYSTFRRNVEHATKEAKRFQKELQKDATERFKD